MAVGSGFGPPAPDAEASVVDTFNDSVDQLHAVLSRLNSRIVDTGASHMLRTEAKTVLSLLLLRLDYAVRTRRRPRRNVFASVVEGPGRKEGKKGGAEEWKWGGGIVDDGHERQKAMMQNYVQGNKRRDAIARTQETVTTAGAGADAVDEEDVHLDAPA